VRPQLRRHQPAECARERAACAEVEVELVPNAPRGRQHGESGAEALHASALLVHRHDEWRRAHRVYRAHERSQLLRIEVVAREQDHTADERVSQQLAFLGKELGPREVDHQRAKTHG
jgi:hypothetical protein